MVQLEDEFDLIWGSLRNDFLISLDSETLVCELYTALPLQLNQ